MAAKASILTPEPEGAIPVTASNVPVGPPWPQLLPDTEPVELHTDKPHSARMYDYWLGGKDNFAADREAAERVLATGVDLRAATRQNRAFLHRATRFLAGEAGVHQFLDIGTGIPTSPNLHELAQEIHPDTRVVYVDNDPIVLAHARALLTGTPQGRTAYLDADLRRPHDIIRSAEVAATLDMSRPVALSLIAVLHFVEDDDEAHAIVRTLVDAVPAGSYLAVSHGTPDFHPHAQASADRYRAHGVPFRIRTRAEVARFFDGLDLLDPGVVAVHRWRPDPDAGPVADESATFCGALARKP